MSEAGFWKYLKSRLPLRAHFQRHEDVAASGIPDLSYAWNGIDGWIELKFYPKWKKQDRNHIDSWTRAQRLWLHKRALAGNGNCFLFVKIEKEYLLFKMSRLYTVDDALENCTRKQLMHNAVGYWKKDILQWELEKHLCCTE